MESGDRMFQNQSRLQALLRQPTGAEIAGNWTTELSQRIRSYFTPAHLGDPAGLEKEPDDFRELDERPFSPRGPAFFHPKSVLNNDGGTLASVSGSHKETRTREEPRSGTQMGRKYLDGNEC